MVPSLHMVKLVQERHTQCKVARLSKNKEVSFQELLNISSSLSKVNNKLIKGTPGVNFMVQVSMLELYNEEIADLLSSDQTKKLQIHENKDKGVYVKDLTSYPVTTVDEMRRKLKEGSANRHVGST